MTDNNPTPQTDPTADELVQQNWELRHQIEDLKAQEIQVWSLLATTNRKLQVYAASIKAAVSSLLNYDIFWDSANQHEFLETIDSSVNQVSEMIVLQTLAFRTRAENLVLRKDAHLLQEILALSQMAAAKKLPELKLEISFPPAGDPILVDYEYLTKALLLLYEVIHASAPAASIQVTAAETDDAWLLDFTGLEPALIDMIVHMFDCQTPPAATEFLAAENILRLHIVCGILRQQQISLYSRVEPDLPPVLSIRLPEIIRQ